jgi:hypothetical protein
MRGIVAKLLTSWLKKKLGCEIRCRFCEPIQLSINKGDAQLHINADIFLGKEELERLLGGDA